MQALEGVLPKLAVPPAGQVGLGWLRTFDLKVSYPWKVRENLRVEPSMAIFNAFNMSNYDLPGNAMNGVLNRRYRVLVLVDEFYLKPAGVGSDTVAARKAEKGFFGSIFGK